MGMALHVRYERLVDLDLVERERLQIGQRRISRAKVVHCDANAKQLEASQDREAAREILDQHALGDFKFQPARRKAGFQQHRMDQSRQVTMAELDWGQIDRDLE